MFDRFTDRARRVVVMAQEEARALGHDHIGTEHLLMGLLHEGDGVAAKVLSEIDVSLEAVRSSVQDLIGPGGQAPPGRIPFTPRAKKVMELSLREALDLGHNYIGTEHLLLGLLREGEGLAAQVLVRLGSPLVRVRQEVIKHLAGYGLLTKRVRTAPAGSALTPAASRALDTARGMAGAQAMGSQQVLLALLADERSLAARALAGIGVTRDQVERSLAAIDPSDSTDELPEEAGGRRTRLAVLGDLVTVQLAEADLAGRLGSLLGRRSGAAGEPALSGSDPDAKGLAKLWKAIHPVVEDICNELEKEKPEK